MVTYYNDQQKNTGIDPIGVLGIGRYSPISGDIGYWAICLLGARVRTILTLGYWVLPNISQYWVVLGTGQYCYWLSYPIPIQYCLDSGHLDNSCQQGNWGGGKVMLESWQMKTQNEIQQTVILAFIIYIFILIAIGWVS